MNTLSCGYSIGLVVHLLIEASGIIVEVMHELKVRLVAVADLKHRPQFLCFWLAELVVDHVSADQHYPLLEEQLGEEGEYDVGMRIMSSLLEVLHIRAQLNK